MKKSISVLLSFLFCIMLLAGCSCRHEWIEASCTAPRTCSKCAVTEGEALGHSWKEADCVTPKTCTRCSLTEGNPLGHNWQDATCTAARHCSICAATEGQPLGHTWEGEATLFTPPLCAVCGMEGETLPGYFAQHDLEANLQPGMAADYVTNTFVRPDLDTTGLLMVSQMQISESDGIQHRYKKGYEWRRVDISIFCEDNNSGLYGTNISFARADYYQDQELKQAGKQERFTVTYHDQEYKCLALYENAGFHFDGISNVFTVTCYVQVPVGYDGVVLAFHHGSIAIDGMHLHEVEDENMILLRLA